ncbi:hypothetical protein ACFFMP_11595 [Pseudoroseomonas cervicalis]
MTAVNEFPMPFMLSPEEAARRTLEGIRRGRTRIAYPFPTYAMARLAGAMPLSLRAFIAARLPAKPVTRLEGALPPQTPPAGDGVPCTRHQWGPDRWVSKGLRPLVGRV